MNDLILQTGIEKDKGVTTMANATVLPQRYFKCDGDKVFSFVYTALIADLENPGNEHTEFPCPCCHGKAWIDKPAGSLNHFHIECPVCGMKVIE